MSATSRLKQLLFLVASLAMVFVGLTGLTTAAVADDTQPCEPMSGATDWFVTDPGAPWVATGESRVKTEGTDPSLTAWVNQGDVIRTEENVSPADPDGTDEASFTNLIKYVFVGATEPEVITPAVPALWANFAPNDQQASFIGPPSWDTDERGTWIVHNNAGGPGQDMSGVYNIGNPAVGGNWFYRQQAVEAVTDIDYLWQKQVRTLVPGTDDVIEYEYTKEAVECPPDEQDGEKVVVCKYVGAPPGTPNQIIVVPVASLGDGFTGTFPYAFGDAQDSIAIRFAVGNEQPGNEELANCPVDEPECPDGDHNGELEGCEPPEECPEGDHNGELPGCEPAEECPDSEDVRHDALVGEPADDECDEDDDDEECPEGTFHAGQEILEGEDPDEVCDEDPIIDPGEGEDPGKNPGNNPGNSPSNNPGSNPSKNPSSNPQGSNLPNNGVTPVAAAPGADVPSAVNAGLAPSERGLTGFGGELGLIAMSTVLLGLGLLGLALRPRRGRILAG